MVMSKDVKKTSCNLITVYILQKGTSLIRCSLLFCLQILKQTFSSFIPDGFVLVIFHNHSAACANRLRRSFLERLSIVHSSHKQIWTLTISHLHSTAEARSSYGTIVCRSILQINSMEKMQSFILEVGRLFMWAMLCQRIDCSGKDSSSQDLHHTWQHKWSINCFRLQ